MCNYFNRLLIQTKPKNKMNNKFTKKKIVSPNFSRKLINRKNGKVGLAYISRSKINDCRYKGSSYKAKLP